MTKISKLIDAGYEIEKSKIGFTVNELMAMLKWSEDQKQYVQNVMVSLTKKGKAVKLNKSRPVIYTLKADSNKSAAPVREDTIAVVKNLPQYSGRGKTPSPPDDASQVESVLTPESLADMEIPLELIGEGVFRRNRELERRIYELEAELVETKRKLDDAGKRIGEQTRMIEKQNQIISGQNRDRRPTVKLKDVSAVTWKRRPKS